MANILPDPNQGNAPQPAWIPGGAAGVPFQPTNTAAAERDAEFLARAALQAEARRKALADPGIARALANQQAAMRAAGAAGAAQQGGGGAVPGSAEEKAQKLIASLNQVAYAANQAYGMSAGAVASLGAAAGASSSWGTLQASITGVQIEMGQGLLPVIDSLSLGLQDVERWMATINPSFKQGAGNVLFYGAAAAGGAYAVFQLVRAFQAARIAIVAMNAATAGTPVGLIVTLTGAVAGLGAAWYMTSRNAREATASMGAAAGVNLPNARATPTSAEIGGMSPEGRRAYAEARDADARRAAVAAEAAEAKKRLAEETDKAAAAGARATPVDEAETLALRRAGMLARMPGMGSMDRERFRAMAEGETPLVVHSRARQLAAEGRSTGLYASDAEQAEAARRLTLRHAAALAGVEDKRFFGAERAGDTPALRAARARLAAAEAVGKKLGADRDLTRDYNVPAARITDMAAMQDAVQIRALAGRDKSEENAAKQLGALTDLKTSMDGVRTEVAAMRGAMPPTSYGRWGRADDDPGGRD